MIERLFQDFLLMGGDGVFVWLCVGITLLALTWEIIRMRYLWRKQQGERLCEHTKSE